MAVGYLVMQFASSLSSNSINRIQTLKQRIGYRKIGLSPLVCLSLHVSWAHQLPN